jgi:hypothetical protein
MMFTTPEITGRTPRQPFIQNAYPPVVSEEQAAALYFQAANTAEQQLPVLFVTVENPFGFEAPQPQQPKQSMEEVNALLEESKKKTQDDLKSIEETIEQSQELRLADIQKRQENLEQFKKQATSKMTLSRSIIRNFEGKNLGALNAEERQLLREAVYTEEQAKTDLNNAIRADMYGAYNLMLDII